MKMKNSYHVLLLLGILGLSVFFSRHASAQELNPIVDKDGIRLVVPTDWEPQYAPATENSSAEDNNNSFVIHTNGALLLMNLYDNPTRQSAKEWFDSQPTRYHLSVQQQSIEATDAIDILILAQSASCETRAMFTVIIANSTHLLELGQIALSDRPSAAEFELMLKGLSISGQDIWPFLAGMSWQFPVSENNECGRQQRNAQEVTEARICPNAPMYIPAEGELRTPWGCFQGNYCADYSPNSPSGSYFQQPHRGLDIGGTLGVTPVYATYNGTIIWQGNSSMDLVFSGAYDGKSAYMAHMALAGPDDTVAEDYRLVSSGSVVSAGQYIGYSGNYGVGSSGPHLHISYVDRRDGYETDFGGTLDPTDFLRLQNLAYYTGWQRSSLICLDSGPVNSCCGCALARSANKETWQEIFLESLIGPSATPSAVSSPSTANATPEPQAIAIPQPPTLKATAEKALSVQSLEQLPELSWQAGSDSDGKIVGYAVYWGNDPLGTSEEKSDLLSYRPNTLTEGSNYLRVAAIDDQGNQSEWQTVATVIQDTTAPSAELEIASGGDTVSTLTTQLQWKGENSAEVRYSRDGKNWSAWESYAPTRLWQLEESDAAQTVYAELRDSAGNVSKTMQASVKVALPQDLPSSSTYRLVSRVMAAGGGVHSGGSFTVKGTAGQDHQTGTLSGGNYQVQSGFWHAPASSNTAPTSVQLTNSAVWRSVTIGQWLLILAGTMLTFWIVRKTVAR